MSDKAVGTRASRIRIAKTAGRVLAAVLAVGFGALAYVYVTLPDVRPLAQANPATTAFIELRKREAQAQGKAARHEQKWVRYGRISTDLTSAVLVAEDDAFFQHEGVDFEQLQESIEIDWARGRMIRGGSTITQQLAKNLYLSPSRNPVRKLRELIIARRLEAELKKARILELYLNVIEWGDGVYGAEAAARTYFHTSASALGPTQAALLAAAIINPRVLDPGKPTPRLVRRQQLILRRMKVVLPPKDEPGISPREEPEGQPENEHEATPAPGNDDPVPPRVEPIEPAETPLSSLISPPAVRKIYSVSG